MDEGLKAEVRMHSREIERMREKMHSNSNVIQRHEDKIEHLEEQSTSRSDNVWKFAALGVSALSLFSAILIPLLTSH